MITIRRPSRRGDRVFASIEAPFANSEVWFRSADVSLEPAIEAWASAALPLAMFRGEPLRCEGELSAQWYRGQEQIQQTLATWYPQLHRVAIECAGLHDALPPTSPTRAVAFFSGGVDSFSTALRHKEDLSGLVLVHGFDIPLGSVDLWKQTRTRMAVAAAGLDLPLLTLGTNVRDFLEVVGRWGEITHGAALASVALVLDASVGTVYIPSTHTYRDLFPWGSHPLIDSLWSTESRSVVHEGAEFTRVQKIAQVAASPVALAHLRVCWQNAGEYNCGQCEKCIRTQCELLVSGAPDDVTFPSSVVPEQVRRLQFPDDNTAAFARELTDSAVQHPILDAMRHALWRHEYHRQMRALRALFRSSPAYILRWGLDRMAGPRERAGASR